MQMKQIITYSFLWLALAWLESTNIVNVVGHDWDLCGSGTRGIQAQKLNVNMTFAGFDITNSDMPRWDSPDGCHNLTLEWGGKWGFSYYWLKLKGDALIYNGYCADTNTLPLDCSSWILWDGSEAVADPTYKIRNCSYFTDRDATDSCMNTTYLVDAGISPATGQYCVLGPTIYTAINGTYEVAGCDLGFPYYEHYDISSYILHRDWCLGYWLIGPDITTLGAYAFCAYSDISLCNNNLYETSAAGWQIDASVTITTGCTPTQAPTLRPTSMPTSPTTSPSHYPTQIPTIPSIAPTFVPTDPSLVPTNAPTNIPSMTPTDVPTSAPTDIPTNAPTNAPTFTPTNNPTGVPSSVPSNAPTTPQPSTSPTIPSDDGLTSVFGGVESTIYMLLGFGITLLLCWILCCFWYVRRRRTRLKDGIAAAQGMDDYGNPKMQTDGTAATTNPAILGQGQQGPIVPGGGIVGVAGANAVQMGQFGPGMIPGQTNTTSHFGEGQGGQTTAAFQQQLFAQQLQFAQQQRAQQQQLQLQQMQQTLRMQQMQQQKMLQQQMAMLQNASMLPQPHVAPNNQATPDGGINNINNNNNLNNNYNQLPQLQPQQLSGSQQAYQPIPFSPSNNSGVSGSGVDSPIVGGAGAPAVVNNVQGMPTNPVAAAFTNGVAGAFMNGNGEAASGVVEDSSSSQNEDLFSEKTTKGQAPPSAFID